MRQTRLLRWVFRIFGLFVAGFFLCSSTANDKPFVVVAKGSASKVPVVADQRLYEDELFTVYKSPYAQRDDFNRLYHVNINNTSTTRSELVQFGDVLHFEPGHFAIARMDMEDVAKLSAKLHLAGMACGTLLRLNGDTIDLRVVAAPAPVHAVDADVAGVRENVAQISADNIKAQVLKLSSIHTRFHETSTGQQVADLLVSDYQTLAAGRSDVSAQAYDHRQVTPQNSIVVRIEGRSRPDEIVVLGSHIDSVNWNNAEEGRSPGADDNASGTATNLEIFRQIMAAGWTFERTLEIHGYAAEEVGLDGSADIASKYRQANKNVVAMVQHDMNLYAPNGDKIWLVSNSTHADLNRSLSQLIDRYVGIPWGSAALTGGSSDHASWTRNGFAAAFPFENPRSYNPHIHTANDDIARSGAFNQAAAFAKLGLAYVAHFAGLMAAE